MHRVKEKVNDMPEDIKKPCPKDEKKKGNIVINADAGKQDDEKKPDEDEEKKKADDIPQWGMELKASVDKLLDLMDRKVDDDEEKPDDEEKKVDASATDEKKQDDDKKPDDEEKQDDDEKPDDEEKQDDDEEDEETKKLKTMVEAALKEAGVEIQKRGKVPTRKEMDKKGLTMEEIFKTPWNKIHKASGYEDLGD